MGYHLRRNLIIFTAFLLLVALDFTTAEDDTTPPNSEEDDDSSSEETVEDSNESRRKRSLELPSIENAGADGAKNAERAAIPGLPDPATIIKIAQILQTVGEKVVPILVEGNPIGDLVAQRVGRDFMFLKNFKDQIDIFTTDFKI